MHPHRFLIHGSIHGMTTDASEHLQQFQRAGGTVETLYDHHAVIVTYEGVCDPTTVESLLYLLEQSGSRAEHAHGVILFGFEDQEPSHLHVGAAEKKPPSLLAAATSIHLKEWLAKKLHRNAPSSNRG